MGLRLRIAQPTQQQEQMRKIDSPDIKSFQAFDKGKVTSAIEKTIRLNKWSTFLLVCAILIPVFPLLAILPIIGIILKIVAHKSGAVHLDYVLDKDKKDEYDRRTGAWHILSEGDRSWQVIHRSHKFNQKVSAGAGGNLKRVVCKIEKTTPFYITTNVATVQIKLYKEILLFLPDRVFNIRKGKVGIVNYEDVSIYVFQTRFVESGTVPRDALVVGSTWQHVNKNGTPDIRYPYNRQLPICQYGTVTLASGTELSVELQFSNVNKTQDFEELIR